MGDLVRLFYNFKFTRLHKDTTPISLGVVSSNGYSFYAEFSDYDIDQVDDWTQENIIDNLMFNSKEKVNHDLSDFTVVKGTFEEVKNKFLEWLDRHFKDNNIEFWGDVSFYDGVFLDELLKVDSKVPENVNPIFFDIATLFRLFGLDPNVDREAFIDKPVEGQKYSPLYSAQIIEYCYYKLQRNKYRYLEKM